MKSVSGQREEASTLEKNGMIQDCIKKPLKIAFLTSFDSRNIRSWSGIPYHMARSLQKHCGEISYIGPMNAPMEMLIGKILHRSSQIFLKKNFMYFHGAMVAKKYGKIAAQKLAGRSFDVIVAPTGAPETAFLETEIPIVLVQDATFALLHNYYPVFSNLQRRSFYELAHIDELALKKASLVIFSSTWAARSAILDYHIDRQKVHVIPFGANFENPPPVTLVEERKKSSSCKLLFIGVDWQRKGGDIAFETLLKLEAMDIQAELVVCGCIPPKTVAHKNMKVIPSLDKNDERQRRELEQLLMSTDFLLVPTRADCTPIVFSEASAYGLPVVTADTGGVSEIVRNGENGIVLSSSAGGSEYAEAIAKIYYDDQRYAEMVRASRAAFEEKFNWDAWGIAIKNLLAERFAISNSSVSSIF